MEFACNWQREARPGQARFFSHKSKKAKGKVSTPFVLNLPPLTYYFHLWLFVRSRGGGRILCFWRGPMRIGATAGRSTSWIFATSDLTTLGSKVLWQYAASKSTPFILPRKTLIVRLQSKLLFLHNFASSFETLLFATSRRLKKKKLILGIINIDKIPKK